jgi:hypothetical protein
MLESFMSADVAVVTKADLAEAVEFSWETASQNFHAVRPGMPIYKLSAKSAKVWINSSHSLAQAAQKRASGHPYSYFGSLLQPFAASIAKPHAIMLSNATATVCS